MKIHCMKCERYCGEIRDAKLIKGLKFMCKSCDSVRDLDRVNNDLFGQFLGSLKHESELKELTRWIK